jgi:chromosome segregation ATPase
MQSGRSPIPSIDSVIKFLQVQKNAYIKQEREIQTERSELERELEELQKLLEAEDQKNAVLKANLEKNKDDFHPVSAAASGRLDYRGHQRTKSDLRESYKNLRELKDQATDAGHSRKKSHQDYLLKIETELPSHIRQNIKTLIASRINTEGGGITGTKNLRLSDINLRKTNSRTSSHHRTLSNLEKHHLRTYAQQIWKAERSTICRLL